MFRSDNLLFSARKSVKISSCESIDLIEQKRLARNISMQDRQARICHLLTGVFVGQ